MSSWWFSLNFNHQRRWVPRTFKKFATESNTCTSQLVAFTDLISLVYISRARSSAILPEYSWWPRSIPQGSMARCEIITYTLTIDVWTVDDDLSCCMRWRLGVVHRQRRSDAQRPKQKTVADLRLIGCRKISSYVNVMPWPAWMHGAPIADEAYMYRH